jgi:hypothetical protein
MSRCRNSAEPARRSWSSCTSAAERSTSVSLESYTRTLSCIRESAFDLATRRDLVTVSSPRNGVCRFFVFSDPSLSVFPTVSEETQSPLILVHWKQTKMIRSETRSG